MLKTPDLGKSLFDALAINLWQKLKKLALNYRIDGQTIANKGIFKHILD